MEALERALDALRWYANGPDTPTHWGTMAREALGDIDRILAATPAPAPAQDR